MIPSLYAMLLERQRSGQPIRVGLIGAGTFGTMFLRQALRAPGIDVVAVVDIDPLRAGNALVAAGFAADSLSFGSPLQRGRVLATDDVEAVLHSEHVDVIVEATGAPLAAIAHIRGAIAAGKDVVNVTVEADALVGPALVHEAEQANRCYSMAYGDQPALICELVDWARINGFGVVAAGKGTLHRPGFASTTPDTVWERYGFDPAVADAAGYDRRMFTSFVDGTKSAIEMAAVAAATGLGVADDGLRFPPAGARDLANVLRPVGAGGTLARSGSVEVVSCVDAAGTTVAEDLRWGVFVVIEAPDLVTMRHFADYGRAVDDTGRYAAIWRPNHLIGMELVTSIASVGILGVPTGSPREHVADVVAVAKRELPGEMELDGEGGYAVYGRLLPAQHAETQRALPIGLSCGLRTTRHISVGEVITWDDVEASPEQEIIAMRDSMVSAGKAAR